MQLSYETLLVIISRGDRGDLGFFGQRSLDTSSSRLAPDS